MMKYPKKSSKKWLAFMGYLLLVWGGGFLVTMGIGVIIMNVTGKADPLGEFMVIFLIYGCISLILSVYVIADFRACFKRE